MSQKSYKELKAELEALIAQAEQQKRVELTGALEQIHGIMKDYDIEPAMVENFCRSKKLPHPTKGAVVKAKYKNPATGETWTGRGKPPHWLKVATNRDDFLIKHA